MPASVRPHGISRLSFLVYLPDLRIWVTVAFWTSLYPASLSAIYALISGFFSSGYDFAIPSSRLYLTIQTLGVAIGFVGNYAPCGLSPQTDGMPVIPEWRAAENRRPVTPIQENLPHRPLPPRQNHPRHWSCRPGAPRHAASGCFQALRQSRGSRYC